MKAATASVGPGRMDPAPALLNSPVEKEITTIMTNESHYCQVAGCHRRAAQCVSIDLPLSWEATRTYVTLGVITGLCRPHGHDVSSRVQALLEARVEFHSLIGIIEAACRYEKAQELRLEAMTDQADRLELENGGLRQDLAHVKAELWLAKRERKQLAVAGGGA